VNKSSPKVVTAEKAVEAIESHDDVVLANFCGEPRFLPMALLNRAYELSGVRIFHYAPFGPFQDKYLEPGMEEHIRCATAFCGRRRSVRQSLSEGRADFYPVTFGNTPRLLREGDFRSDALLLTVSPPDGDGYCSLGVSVDYAWGALERPPRVVIAEVNPNMPKTHGKSFIHVSEIDYIVEVDQPLYELEQSPITEVQVRIGQHVAALVEDCSTLQIGYGGVSEAMVHFLQGKKNLGIHTEMVPEGLRELVAAGAITNARKSVHQGKIVCTFHGGTAKLYEWLDDNPSIEMQPVDYTNDPKVIAMNGKMVAINAALQVDLFGNIYSDLLGLEDQYTGSGGQLDFAIGCTLTHDAKFVTVLPSTTSDEESSRIVTHPTLELNNPRAPQIPTIPRYYADYVVTEYGVAHLKGKPNAERAKVLIQIAHPDFQGILQQQAKELGLL
jgi:4-hydroxybutyrate CoA-transferase